MTGKTHDVAALAALLGVLAWLPSLPAMTPATAVVAFAANFVGGLFPDIDQPTSDFWDNFRLGPYVAKIVCPALGGHRHISHSLIGYGLTGILSQLILGAVSSIVLLDMSPIWWSFMIGVTAHLLTDLPTKAGLPLLWPLRWKFGIPPWRFLRIESDSFLENWLVFPGFVFLCLWFLYTYDQHYLSLWHQIF
jgi:inner membrane protein